jgi:hypothetical protein
VLLVRTIPTVRFAKSGCKDSLCVRDFRRALTKYAEDASEHLAAGIDEIMGRLPDAISVVARAASALLGAQEREGSTAGAEVGDEITTLLHGVRCVRRAYDALDVAVREVRA